MWSVLVISLLTVYVFYLYLKHKYSFWSDKYVKCLKPSIIWGNLNGVGTQTHLVQRYQECYNKFVKNEIYCGFYYLTSPRLIALDLDFIRDVTNNSHSFHDRGIYFNESDPMSSHLFNLEGDKWLNLHNKLAPILTKDQMNNMLESVLYIGDELTNLMALNSRNKTVVDIKDVSLRFNTDLIGAYALALESNALKKGDSNLVEIARKIFDFKSSSKKYKYFLQNTFKDLSRLLRLRVFDSDVEEFFTTTVNKTLIYREKNKFLNRNDFLTLLLQIKKNGMIDDDETAQNLGTFTQQELVTQVFMLFLSGLDTSSTTMAYCMYELAVNQDIQTKVRDEIKNSLNKERLTFNRIMEMTYLEQVLKGKRFFPNKPLYTFQHYFMDFFRFSFFFFVSFFFEYLFLETLRKYSPVHTIYRETTESYTVPGTERSIEQGTSIIIPVYSIHHNPDIYPKPDEFNPDRFTPIEIRKRHPSSFLAFGDGSRGCLGKTFGILNIKMGLISILADYRVTLNGKTTTPLVLDPKNLLLDTKGGIWLNVERV